MSLFGSIYDDTSAGPEPIDVPDSPLAASESEAANADAPSMSLKEFATEVFGTTGAGELEDIDGQPQLVPVEPAFEEQERPVATVTAAEPETAEAAIEPAMPYVSEVQPLTSDAPPLDVFSIINDDLLPTGRPRRTVSLPSSPGRGAARHLKMALLLLVALVAGFIGYRTVAGSGGDAADVPDAPAEVVGADGTGAPSARGIGGALDATQLTAAELELRNAAVQAQAQFAETGSFAASAEQWGQRIGDQVVAAEGAPAPGVLQVASDADAACFQTATRAGTTVAVGVAGGGVTFASDATGAKVCTTDAAVLASWAPTLSPLGS